MIKYIIVDDETASHDNIKDYASNLSYLSFQKSCYNAFEALEYLNKHSIESYGKITYAIVEFWKGEI